MHLTMTDVNTDTALQKRVKALYQQSFPREERIPWWLLRLNSRRKGIDLTAYLDGDTLCGFTSSVTVERLHFLLFFAVEQSCRGCGYGSAILSAIKKAHDTVVLNVEPLISAAPNYWQRQKRFAFYRKNGFVDTGYFVWEIGGKFQVLSTQAQLDVPAYKQVFRKLTCGLWDVKLKRQQEN